MNGTPKKMWLVEHWDCRRSGGRGSNLGILEYLERDGRSPYAKWFESLSAPAAAQVAVAVTRLALGNFSNLKSVGSGVYECRVNFGPGLRI